MWARDTAVSLGKPKRDIWLDSYFAILRAAEQGVGIALGIVPMVDPWLKQKKLVALWPQHRIRIPQSYYLLCRAGDTDRADIAAFRVWLKALLKSQKMLN